MATVQRGDGRQIPYPSDYFDYVYSMIHHSDEPSKIVSEIMRVLKPSGRFNVQVYAKWLYFPVLLMLYHGAAWRNHIENSTAPVHIDLYTARSLRKLFPVQVEVTKHQGFPSEQFARLWGWFLIATGTKV